MKDTIHIDDLAQPVLTDIQRAAMASAQPVALEAEAVLDAARAATGLSDFGPSDFRERLDVWLKSFDEDEALNTFGRSIAFGECVRYATTRLRFQDLLKRHPEIVEVEIDRPIMIAGLPRSGTTHLVNMMAVDPRLRKTPLWETFEPIPGPDDVGDPDPRFVRAQQMWEGIEKMMPLLPAMHGMEPEHIHEDIELQGPDFSSYLPEWISRPYRWRDYYLSHDQTPHYAYGKRLMQAMTWLKGPNRWLVKSPPHMENFGALMAVHPTAIVPVTHRDPLAVVQSAITMLAYGERVRRTHQDLKQLADYWLDRIESLLRSCIRDRHLLPEKQAIDILFHEYMADQKGTVAKIFAMADLEMTPDAQDRIDTFLATNPRGKHGQVIYDLAGDFGVNIGEARERFQFYYDRFPVRKERLTGEKA